MKRFCCILGTIATLLFICMTVNMICNERMLKQYKEGSYTENKLSFLGFTEPCISAYNRGNVHYQKSEYDAAITDYQTALTRFPSAKKECSIRINLVLSMITKLETGDLTKEQVSANLSVIKDAKEVLTIHGCATADHKGHSKKAQTLYDELSELEEELKELNGSGSSTSNSKDTKEEESETPDQKKEEQLKELQRESTTARKEELQTQELIDNFEYYDGASW